MKRWMVLRECMVKKVFKETDKKKDLILMLKEAWLCPEKLAAQSRDLLKFRLHSLSSRIACTAPANNLY